MNAIFDEKTNKWSINDLTEEQIDLMRDCVDVIRRHLYYDLESHYRVDSKNVKCMYDKEEYKVLQSITF